MGKYYRANNKRGYLNARITSSSTQLELQDIDYGVEEQKDRNIPTIVDETMRLVIWGVQYPNPSADPDREIVSAVWSGSGQVFDITRAREGTEVGEHYIGDNVALLFTADMSREILIFEDFESSPAGSIAYTDDTDEDEEMEVLNLPPDDEVSQVTLPLSLALRDSYVDGIDSQKTVYWINTRHVWFTQTFTPTEDYDVSSVILKLYRTGLPGLLSVSIRATDDGGKPTGPDLHAGTFDGNEITTDTDGEEITFSFSGALVNGDKYALILKAPTNERTYVNWKVDKVDGGYSGGSTYISIDGGVTWTIDFIRRIICGGLPDAGYRGWRIDDDGTIYQNLPGLGGDSFASIVCADGKFFITGGNTVWKFNKDGTVDTSWQGDGSRGGFGTAVLDLALDADENLYVVNTRPGVATSGETIWKLDQDGEVIWSSYPLNYSRSVSSVVVHSDGYVYVAASNPTGGSRRGMKLHPADGTVLVTYTAYSKANHIAIDSFGVVYLSGGTVSGYTLYRFANNGSYLSRAALGDLTMSDVFVQSGVSAEDTKVFAAGRYTVDDKSVWKLNYDLSIVEASYKGYYSYSITEDIDGNLLVACHSTIAGEDGIYQIVKLKASDLSFISGIKFNDAELKHVTRQVLSDPVGEDGDFYFKIYGSAAEVEKEYRKILVSGGVGEAPYWQFIWAEEVGGTKQV